MGHIHVQTVPTKVRRHINRSVWPGPTVFAETSVLEKLVGILCSSCPFEQSDPHVGRIHKQTVPVIL